MSYLSFLLCIAVSYKKQELFIICKHMGSLTFRVAYHLIFLCFGFRPVFCVPNVADIFELHIIDCLLNFFH
jgi:hypothetical protein